MHTHTHTHGCAATIFSIGHPSRYVSIAGSGASRAKEGQFHSNYKRTLTHTHICVRHYLADLLGLSASVLRLNVCIFGAVPEAHVPGKGLPPQVTLNTRTWAVTTW